MSANSESIAGRPARPGAALPLRLAVAVAGLWLAGAGARASWAAGSICRQDCAKGPCAQTLCDDAGAAGGYCRCAGGSQAWDSATFSSWCVAWGQPLSACGTAVPLVHAAGEPPPVQITSPEVMAASLRAANPWVATLIGALHDGKRWADGAAQGLVHDSYFDAEKRTVLHTVALPFTARVTSDGSGAAQIDVVVAGDLARLARLKRYADGAAPAAMLPQRIQGAVSAGGLHGSLRAVAADGREQPIQW